MISGPGPTPNLLRQYELGQVPAEMAHENDEASGGHGDEPTKDGRPVRRWWRRLLRRQ